jgi:hypothetical protein
MNVLSLRPPWIPGVPAVGYDGRSRDYGWGTGRSASARWRTRSFC